MRLLDQTDIPFNLKVQADFFKGANAEAKFGLNPLITTTSNPEDIWEGGGTYTFSETADILSIASTNVGDNIDIEIAGLDSDGIEVSQTVTLNGTTRVALPTPLQRVIRMQNASDTDLQGTARCYVGTGSIPGEGSNLIRAIIDNGSNQTQMAIYTVPKDKVGFLVRGEVGLEYAAGGFFSSEAGARCTYRTRIPGEAFKTKKVATITSSGSSIYKDNRSFPDILPGLTDIKIRCEEVSEDLGVWATFDVLLVDVTFFSAEYLAKIGQPT